ncbi:hypothetical protein [Ammoniphilus sp. CFH 90114]|uniref:hypothetical protein n=1 Tax=Ammoniphilus sp. CFH 90114 TaxID=2493665 RepID=UPI00100E46D3|nr:hypothetical protein [Ammoniphilus sp. CFH 90114]RXT14945.1 hypothetical protein EIZ39_01685 [Ammoniphilus sp. CFH 90114]
MGIGMNFVCKCCEYDTGILMLHQGSQDSLQEVVKKYIYTYSHEIDLLMHPNRINEYKRILEKVNVENTETAYHYDACVCYACRKTFELLDVLERKEEEVYAWDKGVSRSNENPIKQMFKLSEDNWSSLLGDDPHCVFCNQMVVKITEELIERGLSCPKCNNGKLVAGEEFELWE